MMGQKMTLMKKATAFLIGIFLFIGAPGVQAVTIDGAAEPEWSMENAAAENGVFTLGGTAKQASGGKIETPAYQMDNDMLFIRLKTAVDGGGRSLRAASTVRNATEMLRIDENNVQAFGGAASVAVADHQEHEIILAMDFSVSPAKTAFWFDGELKETGTCEKAEKIDRAAIYFTMVNYGDGDWVLWDFFAGDGAAAPSITASPADGSAVYAAETEAVTLNFGTWVSPLMGSADNYTLTRDGETVPVTVIPVSPGNAAKISPVGGFSGTAEYTLCAAKTEDLFGRETEPITIRFTVVTEDYRLPTIVFGEDIGQMEIHTGEIVPISIVPGDETKLDRIEIFVDGAIDAVLDTAPYTYSFCYDTPGSVTLTAVGYDASGLSCSIEANITVIKNDPPQLRVEGIADGGIYRPDTITPIKAYAYDRDGIDKILCIADGKEIAAVNADTAEFSLSGLTGGTHQITVCAIDRYGAAQSQDFRITLESNARILLTNHDFSSYAGGSEQPSGCWGGQQRGYLDCRVINPAFGKSLIIGMDTVNEAYAPDNAAYMGLGTTTIDGKGFIELDLYIDQKPGLRALPSADGNDRDGFKFTFKKNGAAESTLFSITGDGIEIAGESVPYAEKEWYHLMIGTDVKSRTATVTVTGGELSRTFSLGIASGQDEINYLRVYGPVFDAVKTFIAIDNVYVYEGMDLPTLTFSDEIEAGAQKVTCKISAALSAKDLTPETVTLTDEAGSVMPITEIRTEEGTVILTLASPLKSGTRYTLTISASVRYAGGEALGFAVEGSFLTRTGDFAITGGSFEDGAFTVTAVNTTKNAVDAYVVLQVWSGGRIKKVQIKPLSIPSESGAADHRVSAPYLQRGERMTAYLFRDYRRPKTLTTKVFAVEK